MVDFFSPGHIILVLIGALLIFGPKRLPDIGKSLGKGIREFKGALNHLTDDEPPTSSTPAAVPPAAPAQAVAQPVDAAPAPVAPAPAVPAPAPVDTPSPPPLA
ncbi:MAG: sec-independent protein translocase protein TatA [Actinomycetota bacterium]|jgi:sec-independent protein translocase protein TatA|nr:sec-independent protein translocase protein TatA [Actinomycetota bacterium]